MAPMEEEIEETETQARKDGFVSVGDVVARLTGSIREDPRGKARFLGLTWAKAVGNHIAKHSEPDRLMRGVLTVRVDSPTWSSELLHMKPTVLAKIQEISPGSGITNLRFVQGSLRSKLDHSEEKVAASPLPPPLPEESERASKMVSQVEDPDLRAALFKLCQTWLIRQRCG